MTFQVSSYSTILRGLRAFTLQTPFFAQSWSHATQQANSTIQDTITERQNWRIPNQSTTPASLPPKIEGQSSTGQDQPMAVAEKQRSSHGHDTHAIPPQGICDVFKKYQRMSDADINHDPDVVDFARGLSAEQALKVRRVDQISAEVVEKVSREFLEHDGDGEREGDLDSLELDVVPCAVYAHADFPGLRLLPALLPEKVQIALVDQILHEELSCKLHKTNLHDDYHLPYPSPESTISSQAPSFFTLPQGSPLHTLTPRNPQPDQVPLTLAQFLQKRWRWLTFGTQYNWSTREYPSKDQVPSQFSPRIAALVAGLFPRIRAESGVVLIYSAKKDFMPVHRDVSELCERELCSITLGCDGLFIVALDQDQDQDESEQAAIIVPGEEPRIAGDDQERPQKTAVIRVRSGDVVLMSDATRWSWHAMPKVMAKTCPEFLRDWPLKPGMNPRGIDTRAYETWKGYMSRKRVNISCRQVYD